MHTVYDPLVQDELMIGNITDNISKFVCDHNDLRIQSWSVEAAVNTKRI
jgi:hypothetical protein